MSRVIKQHIVPETETRKSLTQYIMEISDIYPSRKSAYKAVKRGEILINGESYEPGKWISPGQKIEILEPEHQDIPIYNKKLAVIIEDKHIAVVEKPPGIMVNGNAFNTVEHMLPANLFLSDERDALASPRPVHRLDLATGGLVLVAKTSRAHIELSRQFEKKEIVKKYKAIVMGKIEGQGEIKDPIETKDALTIYQAITSVPSLKSTYLTLMDLYPKTGRTHQLRKHLAQIGHPILGDKQYGMSGHILRSKGLFLWAIELSFRHPETGQFLTIAIDPPLKFQTTLKREKRRWSRYHPE